MSEPLLFRVRNALTQVINPDSGRNIVADGAVHGLTADESGTVRFALQLPPEPSFDANMLLAQAKEAAQNVSGVTHVSAVASAHRQSTENRPAAGGHQNPLGMKKKPAAEKAAEGVKHVKRMIAVASGKGGVGKSTIAANLAVALSKLGLRVGLLDADIYGPSLPTLFGLKGKAEVRDGKLQPFEAYGVRAMSIGLIVDPDQALAWRGPMVMGALNQLISDVDWGELDVMLIDTPPGTGDAHLSLIQTKRLDGTIIVSTPQEMALADMRRGVTLFRKTDTPVIGVIENMAWLEAADGSRQYLFGQGGAEKAAGELDAPFLGAIPIYPQLREASDAGEPAAKGDTPVAQQFEVIAKSLMEFIRDD